MLKKSFHRITLLRPSGEFLARNSSYQNELLRLLLTKIDQQSDRCAGPGAHPSVCLAMRHCQGSWPAHPGWKGMLWAQRSAKVGQLQVTS